MLQINQIVRIFVLCLTVITVLLSKNLDQTLSKRKIIDLSGKQIGEHEGIIITRLVKEKELRSQALNPSMS